MPLTPEDVRNKRFTPVRLREGYDMGEVDQFLDDVETELERLTGENTELRDRMETVSAGPVATAASLPIDATPEPEPEREPEPEPEPVVAPVAVAPPTAGEASTAAVRLLEIATRNADEVVTEAKAQAAAIIGEAQAEAARLDEQSRAVADQVETEAQSRAETLASEAATRRQQLFGDLERERDELTQEVQHLQTFEREYRDRLRTYFEAQLAHLAGEPEADTSLPGQPNDGEGDPERLRSLLSEEPSNQS